MQHPPPLIADCENCAALCCVSFPFDAGNTFAYDKRADEPCHNLDAGHKCIIHDMRSAQGFSGCLVFDCHGAGQRVTQELFKGESWRDDPNLLAPMGRAIRKMRLMHEFLAMMVAAGKLDLPDSLQTDIRLLVQTICPQTPFTPETLEQFDIVDLELRIQAVLQAIRNAIPQSTAQ